MDSEKAVLSARIEPEYVASLDAVAKSQGISRSKLLREFALKAAPPHTSFSRRRKRDSK